MSDWFPLKLQFDVKCQECLATLFNGDDAYARSPSSKTSWAFKCLDCYTSKQEEKSKCESDSESDNTTESREEDNISVIDSDNDEDEYDTEDSMIDTDDDYAETDSLSPLQELFRKMTNYQRTRYIQIQL